jgi:ATP-dependent Clp protease ATP-binding subunit ClpA
VELTKARAALEDMIESGKAPPFVPTAGPASDGTGLDLSHPSRAAIEYARAEARRLGHDSVAVEHVLLGLVREGGTATAILQALGLAVDDVRAHVVAALGEQQPRAHEVPTPQFDPLGVDSHNLLTYAREEATRRRHTYLGSEHLLLALRRHYSPVLKQLWAEFGLDADALANHIDATIPPGATPGPYAGGMTPQLTRIISSAQASARRQGHQAVPPEYLLLALLDHDQDLPAQVLGAAGVDAERFRRALDRELRN